MQNAVTGPPPAGCKNTRPILVVGAGFAGAVHARQLAEAGHRVDLIDRRAHIGGNTYDEPSPEGVRLHRYGPHLLHTSNAEVVAWLGRFTDFIPYQHRVQVRLPHGPPVPLPINRQTINQVFGTALTDAAQVEAFLASVAVPIAAPANAAEHLMARIGRDLTDLFFRPYTRKMWALDLEDMDAAVVKRIPIRLDDEDRYFPDDRYQLLPRDGYAAAFRGILDHPNISVSLSVPFDRAMLAGYRACFNSMPIDEFFDFAHGALPYRSIRFHHRAEPAGYGGARAAVVNFTDDGRFTRETDWSRLPGHRLRATGCTTVTLEEPCDYAENGYERYYPVKTADHRFQQAYDRYKALAEADGSCIFIGRCGTYQYLDMHQVINQSLASVRRWLACNS